MDRLKILEEAFEESLPKEEKEEYRMKHPEIVRRALSELINELQFRIETEPNSPDIEKVKSDLTKAQEEFNAIPASPRG
jgi:sugar-specific transcriptional regulator TrmB